LRSIIGKQSYSAMNIKHIIMLVEGLRKTESGLRVTGGVPEPALFLYSGGSLYFHPPRLDI
jgi:hypothetical protein